jgi:hypothetical protein
VRVSHYARQRAFGRGRLEGESKNSISTVRICKNGQSRDASAVGIDSHFADGVALVMGEGCGADSKQHRGQGCEKHGELYEL